MAFKTLMLMRHAKAASDSPTGDDHTRPLNERGRKAAKSMGQHIKKIGIIPQIIISSDAQRTSETLQYIKQELGQDVITNHNPALYLATAGDILHIVNQLPEQYSHVMLIGHNPGFHLFSHALCAEGEKNLLCKLEEKFPTATLVIAKLPNMPWSQIELGTGTLTHCIRPEDIM